MVVEKFIKDYFTHKLLYSKTSFHARTRFYFLQPPVYKSHKQNVQIQKENLSQTSKIKNFLKFPKSNTTNIEDMNYNERQKYYKPMYDEVLKLRINAKNLPCTKSQEVIDKLDPKIQNDLKKQNLALYKCQTQSFEPIMEGKDLLIQSPTGSGKTLSFILPLIDIALKEKLDDLEPEMNEDNELALKPKIIIIASNAEDVCRIEQEFEKFSESVENLGIGALYPGRMSKTQLNIMRYLNGCDILITVPRRANEVLGTDISTEDLKMIVIDDMEKIIQQGRFDQIKSLAKKCGKNDEEGTKLEKPQIVILSDQTPLYVTRPCRNDLLYRKTFQHLIVYPKTEREQEIDMLNEFRQMLNLEPIQPETVPDPVNNNETVVTQTL